MSIQDILDSMGDAAQVQRAKYHVTLGQLIGTLEDAVNEQDTVEFSNGTPVGRPISYRGYYIDLALTSGDEETGVVDLLNTLRDANGSDFTGYKGGEFTMGVTTPLWNAEYGDTGRPILRTETDDEVLVLVLGDEEF